MFRKSILAIAAICGLMISLTAPGSAEAHRRHRHHHSHHHGWHHGPYFVGPPIVRGSYYPATYYYGYPTYWAPYGYGPNYGNSIYFSVGF